MNAADLIFWVLALVILGSALGLVMVKNLVHAALFMVLTFFGISGIYVLLEADFLAVVQIFIYVGAIAVLIIFGVMLTQRENMGETNTFSSFSKFAGITVIPFLGIVLFALLKTPWMIQPGPALESTVGPIADLMLSSFVIPFEAVAILLTVAILGAIILSKGAGRSS